MDHTTSTPRQALRTINDDQDSIRAQKSVQAGKPVLQAPVQKLYNPSSRPLEAIITEPKQRTKTKERAPEVMNVFNPEEDLKPKTDKLLFGVVGKLRMWRPPCFFGLASPDSDFEDDDDDKPHNALDTSDVASDVLPLPEEDTLFGVELANLSDLHIPEVDIEDLPLPYLDDSIDIEPNMGTLEIWNTSSVATEPGAES